MAALIGDKFNFGVMHSIRNSFLNQNYHYSNYWDVSELDSVSNLELEAQYNVKKNELLLLGRTEEETTERLLMDCYKNVEDVKFVSLNGLQCGKHANSFLGDGTKGVTLGKHADVLLRSFYNDGHEQCCLVVYKVILGRQKEVLPIQTPPFREPAQDADCHVSLLSPAPNDDDLHVQEIKAQVYVYDKDEEGEFLRRPRQCVPIAYVMFKRAPSRAHRHHHQSVTIRDNEIVTSEEPEDSVTPQTDDITKTQRSVKTQEQVNNDRAVAWQLVPLDVEATSGQQKSSRPSNQQKRMLTKSKETGETLITNKRITRSALRNYSRPQKNHKSEQFTVKPTTNLEFDSSDDGKLLRQKTDNRHVASDSLREWKIPLHSSRPEHSKLTPTDHPTNSRLNPTKNRSLPAKTVSWSTDLRSVSTSTAAVGLLPDPVKRQQTRDSSSSLPSPNALSPNPVAPSDTALHLRITSDGDNVVKNRDPRMKSSVIFTHKMSPLNEGRVAAVGPRERSPVRKTRLIEPLPLPSSSSSSLVPSVNGSRSKMPHTGCGILQARKAAFNMSLAFPSPRMATDPRTINKSAPNLFSNSSLSKASNAVPGPLRLRHRTPLRRRKIPPQTPASSSSFSSSSAPTGTKHDVALDVLSNQRSIDKTFLNNDTRTVAVAANIRCASTVANKPRPCFDLQSGVKVDASLAKEGRLGDFASSKSSPLSIFNANQWSAPLRAKISSNSEAMSVPAARSGTALKEVSLVQSSVCSLIAQSDTKVVGVQRQSAAVCGTFRHKETSLDSRNFSLDRTSRTIIPTHSTVQVVSRSTMSVEYRPSLGHPDGVLNSLNGPLSMASCSTASVKELVTCGPSGLVSVERSPGERRGLLDVPVNFTGESQQQKLLLLQHGFISSITKQLASDLNDVANVLRNSRQCKATETEKTASAYLREINSKFMELSPVCVKYKQMFRCFHEFTSASLPDCGQLYEHEQILKSCCDVLGRVFSELKSFQVSQNESTQKYRTCTWLVDKKSVLFNCIDAIKTVLENVVSKSAFDQKNQPNSVLFADGNHQSTTTQKETSNECIKKANALLEKPNALKIHPCKATEKQHGISPPQSHPLNTTDMKNIVSPLISSRNSNSAAHSTENVREKSVDRHPAKDSISSVEGRNDDSRESFAAVEIGRSDGIAMEGSLDDQTTAENEIRKEAEGEEGTVRECSRKEQTKATIAEDDDDSGTLNTTTYNGKAVDSALEHIQISKRHSLDCNANESLSSFVSQTGGGPEPLASSASINSNANEEVIVSANGAFVSSADDEIPVSCNGSIMMKNPKRISSDDTEDLDTNTVTGVCRDHQQNPSGNGALTVAPVTPSAPASESDVSLESQCIATSMPVIKMEKEDDQQMNLHNIPRPSHTIIFDADDFAPPSNLSDARGNDTRGNDTRGNDTRGNDTRGNDTRGSDSRLTALQQLCCAKGRLISVGGSSGIEIVVQSNDEMERRVMSSREVKSVFMTKGGEGGGGGGVGGGAGGGGGVGGDEFLPPLLTPNSAFESPTPLFNVKYEDEPPILEANNSTTVTEDPGDDHPVTVAATLPSSRFSNTRTSAPVSKPSFKSESSLSSHCLCAVSTNALKTSDVWSECHDEASSILQQMTNKMIDSSEKLSIGRVIGEITMPKDPGPGDDDDDDGALYAQRPDFGAKREEHCPTDDTDGQKCPFETPVGSRGLSCDDGKGLITCGVTSEIHPIIVRFDCCYESSAGEDFAKLGETQFVVRIEPDDDFDPDSVCSFGPKESTDKAVSEKSSGLGCGQNFLINELKSVQNDSSVSESDTRHSFDASECSLERTEVEAYSVNPPVSELDLGNSSTSEAFNQTDTGSDAGCLASAAESSLGHGTVNSSVDDNGNSSMTVVYSESPESPSPESSAMYPVFHGRLYGSSCRVPSGKRKRQKHKDQKPIAIAAEEQKHSVVAKEKKKELDAGEASTEPPLKRRRLPQWSLRTYSTSAEREIRDSFSKLAECHLSLRNDERLSFTGKSETAANNSSSYKDSERVGDLMLQHERTETQHSDANRILTTEDRKIDEKEETRPWSSSEKDVQNSSVDRSRISCRNEEFERETKHSELLRNEIKSYEKLCRNSYKRDYLPRETKVTRPRDAGCYYGAESLSESVLRGSHQSPFRRRDWSRSHSGNDDEADGVVVESRSRDDYGRSRKTDSVESRSRDDYGRSIKTLDYCHRNDETRWRREVRGQRWREEVRGQRWGNRLEYDGQRSMRPTSMTESRQWQNKPYYVTCDQSNGTYQRITDPSKLKRQFWSRGHPRFRCNDRCDHSGCQPDPVSKPQVHKYPSRPSSHSFRSSEDILEETLLVNLKSVMKDDEDADCSVDGAPGEEEIKANRRRRRRKRGTMKRDHEDEKELDREEFRSTTSSKRSRSTHDSEWDTKDSLVSERRSHSGSDKRFRNEFSETDRVRKKESDHRGRPTASTLPSAEPQLRTGTPSSSSCSSVHRYFGRRSEEKDSSVCFEEKQAAIESRTTRDQTRQAYSSSLGSDSAAADPADGPGTVYIRPGGAQSPSASAVTYVTKVFHTKNFSTEVSFGRFKP